MDTLGKLSLVNGRMEISARLPPPTFRSWPAGWLISEANRRDAGLCWPLAPEIDCYEAAAGAGPGSGLDGAAVCGSYHWGDRCFVDAGQARTGCLSHGELRYDEGFHTYAVEWWPEPNPVIRWWIDGRQVFEVNRGSDPRAPLPPGHRMMAVINTVCSGVVVVGGKRAGGGAAVWGARSPLSHRLRPPTLNPPHPAPLPQALAWWIDPPSRPPGIGDGYMFHYVDWIRLWTRE